MALPQLPPHALNQLGQGVNKENPLTRVYAKRAANCLAALFVYALSPMEINSPLLFIWVPKKVRDFFGRAEVAVAQ